MKRPLPNPHIPLDQNPFAWAGLVTSLHEEFSYDCRIEGRLPSLNGKLFKLGPGLYERGEGRKRMVLDGDGMMQEFHFQGDRVHYRNRFIRTKKFVAEEKANRFLYPTLSTHSSGPWQENLGISLPHQANITPLVVGQKLLAFDESQRPYQLDPESLSTLSETDLDQLQPELRFWAHYKLDPKKQEAHFLALKQGPVIQAHIVSQNAAGQVVNRCHFKLPRASYFHDWFFTENYFGFILHPAIVSLKTLLRVGLGIDTFSDALKWQPDMGNVIFLVDRRTLQTQTFETTACWMWHSVNAYEDHQEVFVDFIGSEAGGGLGDPDSPLFAIMRNEEVHVPSQTTNHLRRYQISTQSKSIRYETLDQSGNFELPTVSVSRRGQSYDYSHFIKAAPGEFFARGLGEWNQRSQSFSHFMSPEQEYFSEPLSFASAAQDSDHLSSLVYCSKTRLSYLGIFVKGRLADGPIAKIWLQHHSPLGFHGYWMPHSAQ